MKNFINKISKGSKIALFLEILLLVQIVLIAFLAISNENINLDKYCKEHGYSHHSEISEYVVGE